MTAPGSTWRPSHRSDRAHRSRALRWAGGFLVLLAVVVAVATRRDASGDGGPAAIPPVTSTPSPAPEVAPVTPDPTPSSSATPVERRGKVPEAVQAGAIDVRATVVPIRAEGKVLTPPSDVSEVGWWSGGARAGASHGSVLLTGHTVHTGGGVFDDLGSLDVGDRVEVGTAGRTVGYEVSTVRYLDKAELYDAAPRLFDQAGPPRLVLITCEAWDGAEYDGNTVVVATPISA